MEIIARNKTHPREETTSADHENTMGHSMQTKGFMSDSKLAKVCRNLFRISAKGQRDCRRSVLTTLLDAGITFLRVLRTNRYLQFIIILAALTLLLIHIYCLPADCDDPFFTPRTNKQFPLDYGYVLDAGKLCAVNKDGSDVFREIDVVILVLTMSQNVQERQAIRQTYGSVWRGTPWPGTEGENELEPPVGTVRVVFLMGQTKDASYRAREAELLAAESRVHGDVVQWDGVLEDYSNLTLKVLVGMRWVRDWCPHVKHVVKTDDDTFIHLPRFFAHLRRPSDHIDHHSDNIIRGATLGTAGVLRFGKYGVREQAFPLDMYPPHVKGQIYCLPFPLILRILTVAEFIPYNRMEDVHVTGTLGGCVVGAKHYGFTVREFNYCSRNCSACDFRDGVRLASRHVTPENFRQVWEAEKHPEICSTFTTTLLKIASYFRPSRCYFFL